jgi:dipeptidyl aminopeptidase/acylaminoacyl peptidase
MAFVSDRAFCKTWVPNEPDTCYTVDATPPDGGNLYLYSVATGETRQLSDEWLTAAPEWITNTRISFTAGERGELLSGSVLSWIDVNSGDVTTISPTNDGITGLDASWSPDGSKVVYQEAGTETAIVVRDAAGLELARLTDFTFPRFGFAGAWSPDGLRLVLAGRGGQCPYGLIVLNAAFESIYRAQPRPGACDPVWSPDGRYIAFSGVMPGEDGVFNVYMSSPSGGGTRNITGALGGQIRPLWWVGQVQ